MIYLDNVLQKKIIATFHYSLNPKGNLVLGKSEAVSTSPQLFSQVEKKFKVFTKKKDANNSAKFEMNYRIPGVERSVISAHTATEKNISVVSKEFEKSVDEILLNKYVPASVVINQDLEILQFRGSTSLFLEPSPGKASLNLLKMVRAGLAFELRNAIHKCSKSDKATKKTEIEVKIKSVVHFVTIEVLPLRAEDEEKMFLVIFEESNGITGSDSKPSLTKDKKIKQLVEELQHAKDDMRSMLEEQEASVEELQSANEEIVSSNEELQSINEELETSKEEVESTNEELMTINTELQVRNEQLAESYEYAEAVFNTIREAVVILDKAFRVRTANKAFYKAFRVTEEETEGLLIYELGNRQWDIHKLRQLLEEVIPNNTQVTGYEVVHTFPEIGEKIMLINARRILQKTHRQQLILIAIDDVTEHRQAQRIMAEREAWFRNMADRAPVMIWVADSDKRRSFFNTTWLEYTGKNIEQETGIGWYDDIHPDDLPRYLDNYELSFYQRVAFTIEYRIKQNNGEYRWILENAKPTYTSASTFSGFIGSCTEIHDKKLMHDDLERRVDKRTYDLQEINNELIRSNSELQQFAYVASHDLQEPLRKILTFADKMQSLKNVLPETGVNYLNKIVSSSKRMTNLIDALLNFSRTSRIEKFVPTNLNRIVRTVLDDFEVILSEKEGVITHDTLPIVDAIPVQMEQLFHNLISNALKFSKPETPPQITISSRPFSENVTPNNKKLNNSIKYVEIIVKDNGIGFSPEFSEQIFIIFQRLNERNAYPGTGIGLALCRKIVNNHNGDIYAISSEGNGATFHIILPVKHPDVLRD
jgi:two-component system CheB/CheR fusion protein